MSEELKPCPFCGGEAEITKWHEGYFVECKEQRCGGTIGAYKTEEETIQAWNTREERTCHFRNDGHGILWCDAEGCDYDMDDYLPIPKHCPNCGAKVVN